MIKSIITGMVFFLICNISYALPLNSLKLPPGFSIEVYASIPDAREMTRGSEDIVFVGTREVGKVFAIVPDKINSHKNQAVTIASHLNMPNGVAFYKGDLYVAAVNRILKFPNIEANIHHPPKPIVITDSLPSDSHHGLRYISFGPDGKLYIGIGAPCNNCLSSDKRFATIMRMNPDGTNHEIYAEGVRNTVGFDWHPVTHDLWFTDNGRDWLGDDAPPDELNQATKPGLHFGYPYCHGNDIADPTYGKQASCSTFIPPKLTLQAHAASLGMLFYTGKMFPSEYQGQIFIAQHGSWNRSKKVGYDVLVANLSSPPTVKPFISGWLQHEEAWGRPVALLMLKDGSLLISDDEAGVIYRVTYQAKLGSS